MTYSSNLYGIAHIYHLYNKPDLVKCPLTSFLKPLYYTQFIDI